jgi:hypothetical protein
VSPFPRSGYAKCDACGDHGTVTSRAQHRAVVLGTPSPPVGAVNSSYGAPIFDAGLALDFTLMPVVDLGLHGSYNTALTQNGTADTPRWIGLGAHLAFVF